VALAIGASTLALILLLKRWPRIPRILSAVIAATQFQSDPFWRDNILLYEYFHGDNGAGLGATTKLAGPDLLPNSSSFTASSMPSGSWKWAEAPRSLKKPAPLGK
jgi:hypothetical protein